MTGCATHSPDLGGIYDEAARHQSKCLRNARQFQAALDVPAVPPPGTDVSLIAGDSEPTLDVLAVTKARTLKAYRFEPGDGVVTRASAVMDERVGQPWTPRIQSPISWDQIVFLSSSHRQMTWSPEFADNILYLLLDKPRAESERKGAL
jgi:hypothetical protein